MNQPTVNKPKKSTTLRNFVACIVLATAILAAGALWVLLGWRGALDITLTDLAGDPAALRGFTMRGQSCLDSAHTYWELRDGYLETSFALDPDNVDTTWRYAYNMAGAITSIFYAVTPESRDAVNAAASLWQPSSGTSQWWESTATTFRPMVTIHLSGGVLRVALPDVTAKEPLAVSANANREHVQRTDWNYDYQVGEYNALRDPRLEYGFVGWNVFPLGARQGLTWRYTFGDTKAGLYKANPISQEEIDALPADGKLQGEDVLCATTELGSMEPFYCPQDADVVACGVAMDDGLTLCVYQNRQGIACADLVNAAGTRVDHTELGTTNWGEGFTADMLPRTTDREVVLQMSGENSSACLTALRVGDGKFILNKSLSCENDIYLRNAGEAVLNTAGDALLVATDEYTYVGEETAENSYNVYNSGTLLLVYPLDGSGTRYRGRLNNGAERDWGSQLGEGSHSNPLRRYMNYEIYEKDRGRV